MAVDVLHRDSPRLPDYMERHDGLGCKMLKGSSAAVDTLARDMCTQIGNAMGGCTQNTSQFTAWINQQFIDQFLAHNVVGAPNALSLAFSTAYQATNPAKPAFVHITVDLTTTVAVGSPQANTCELVVGSTNAVASGTGSIEDTYRSDLSVTLISLGFTGRQSLKAIIPVGYWYAIRRTVGTGITIVSASDQAIG